MFVAVSGWHPVGTTSFAPKRWWYWSPSFCAFIFEHLWGSISSKGNDIFKWLLQRNRCSVGIISKLCLPFGMLGHLAEPSRQSTAFDITTQLCVGFAQSLPKSSRNFERVSNVLVSTSRNAHQQKMQKSGLFLGRLHRLGARYSANCQRRPSLVQLQLGSCCAEEHNYRKAWRFDSLRTANIMIIIHANMGPINIASSQN